MRAVTIALYLVSVAQAHCKSFLHCMLGYVFALLTEKTTSRT